MDHWPGQNVDLGLYFHREGPVSPNMRRKNRFLAEKMRTFQIKYVRVPLRSNWPECRFQLGGSISSLQPGPRKISVSPHY